MLPINDRQNLIDVLMQAINEGTITAYGNATNDDEFQSPMSRSEVDLIGIMEGEKMTIEEKFDPDNQEYYLDTTYNTFQRHDVKKYRIKEEWFDKQRSVMEVRIIGICPVIDRKNEDGISLVKLHYFGCIFLKLDKFYPNLRYLIIERMMQLV